MLWLAVVDVLSVLYLVVLAGPRSCRAPAVDGPAQRLAATCYVMYCYVMHDVKLSGM